MIGGVLLGHFAPQTAERLQPLGDAFVKAMRMLIAPIVFSTVVVGIANMGDMARVGRVALKALIYFESHDDDRAGPRAADGQRLAAGSRHAHRSARRRIVFRRSVCGARPRAGRRSIPDEHHSREHLRRVRRGNVLQVLFIAVLFGAALSGLGEMSRRWWLSLTRVARRSSVWSES
jgi:aerobic C4-dicarboxylate transport protein